MMATTEYQEMDLEAPSSKRRKVDGDHCIICFRTLNSKKESVVNNPTSDGLNAISKACETRKDDVFEALWPLRTADKKRIQVFEMRGLRQILRVSWTAKRTNDWVLDKAEVSRNLLESVKARKLACEAVQKV